MPHEQPRDVPLVQRASPKVHTRATRHMPRSRTEPPNWCMLFIYVCVGRREERQQQKTRPTNDTIVIRRRYVGGRTRYKVRSKEETMERRRRSRSRRRKGVRMDGSLEETAKGGKAEVDRKEQGIFAYEDNGQRRK